MRNMRTPLAMAMAVGLLGGSTVGATAQTTEFIPPIEVSVTDIGPERCANGMAESLDGFMRETGFTCQTMWESSEPRLSGNVKKMWSLDHYEADGELNVGSSATSVTNNEGGWRGRPVPALGFPWDTDDTSHTNVLILDGEGAYKGLVAVLELAEGPDGIRGFVIDSGFPPPPENASTQ